MTIQDTSFNDTVKNVKKLLIFLYSVTAKIRQITAITLCGLIGFHIFGMIWYEIFPETLSANRNLILWAGDVKCSR